MIIEAQGETGPKTRLSSRTSVLLMWSALGVSALAFFLGVLLVVLLAPQADARDLDTFLVIPVVIIFLGDAVAMTLAVRQRGALAGGPFETHVVSAVRTVRIGVAGFGAAVCLVLLLLLVPGVSAAGFGAAGMMIMMAALPLLFVWKSACIVRGLLRAWAKQPID